MVGDAVDRVEDRLQDGDIAALGKAGGDGPAQPTGLTTHERAHVKDLILTALEQALHEHDTGQGLIHHSDRSVQYLSIHHAERRVEAGIEPSVGRVGDSSDNARAETMMGLYKTEVIRHQGPGSGVGEVKLATMAWVARFNQRRLLRSIRDRSPAEFEHACYRNQSESAKAA